MGNTIKVLRQSLRLMSCFLILRCVYSTEDLIARWVICMECTPSIDRHTKGKIKAMGATQQFF